MISFLPGLTVPVQYHVGTEDSFIPAHELAEFEQVLQQHQISAEVYQYAGAVHGFYHYTYPDEYHPEAARLAHQRMCSFFHRHLNGPTPAPADHPVGPI
jgi:carboxymethylenebutenolidase